MVLLCMVSLMSSGSGIAGAGAEMQHEAEQSQAGNLPPAGSEDRPCEHGCVGHLSAHLFSASGNRQPLAVLPLSSSVVPSVSSQVDLRLSDKFFKPPRTS